MKGFLEGVAEHIYNKYEDSLSTLTLVFPGRRASIYFSKYLSRHIKKTTFAPKVISINDLVYSFSNLREADSLSLIFRLFQVYEKVYPQVESFDQFYHWGKMIISDFDDVDKYLVNAEHIFSHIKDLKEIDNRFDYLTDEQKELLAQFWKSFSLKQQGNTQNNFLMIWENLYLLYTTFKKELKTENIAYAGMIYREVAENILNDKIEIDPTEKYIVIGLNALNRCEETLFRALKEKCHAEFYWDYDNYYLKDSYQEAGLFMRRNLKNFPQEETPYNVDGFANKTKNMEIRSVTSNVGQAQLVSEFLSKHIQRGDSLTDTVVVLCDENILLPTLGAIPSTVDKTNVTMGFPIKLTPVYSLIKSLINLLKCREITDNTCRFHYRTVHEVLMNQIVFTHLGSVAKEIINKGHQENKIYYTLNDFEQYNHLLIPLLFQDNRTITHISNYLMDLLQYLFLEIGDEDNSAKMIQKEYIFHLFKTIKRLKELINIEGIKIFKTQNPIDIPTFFSLLEQHLSPLSVPFEGIPLEGLAIMGILETRSLDFRNVVLVSMNEGIMPNANVGSSFIPYNLRSAFDLPKLDEKAAMYAYYFYRLLQRAENIRFVYNSTTDGLSNGEKSRYLYQLQLEGNFNIDEKEIFFNTRAIPKKEIVIESNEDIVSRLKKRFTEKMPLTPSALNTYMDCSLRFYFKYIIGIKEPEETSEDVSPMVFGNIYHKTLEKIYASWTRKMVNKEMLQKVFDNTQYIENIVLEAFRSEAFRNQNIEIVGRNRIVFEILCKYAVQTLKYDQKQAPFIYLSSEDQITLPWVLENGMKIWINGKLDRVDQVDNNTVRIVDYKTGEADLIFKDMKNLFLSEEEEKSSSKRKKAIFQTLFYSMLYDKKYGRESLTIVPQILAIQEIFKSKYCSDIIFNKSKLHYKFVAKDFEEELGILLNKIFSEDAVYSQTTHTKNCEYCTYKQICNR